MRAEDERTSIHEIEVVGLSFVERSIVQWVLTITHQQPQVSEINSVDQKLAHDEAQSVSPPAMRQSRTNIDSLGEEDAMPKWRVDKDTDHIGTRLTAVDAALVRSRG